VAGILVGVFILAGAWRIVREAANVLMEGAPRDLDVGGVSAAIAAIPGVQGVHHLHIWCLSSHLTALSCHVVAEDQTISSGGLLVGRVQQELKDRFGISHATIQLESAVHAPTDPLSIQQKEGVARL
jgi:cobalt-zinc-cadmium efflux system protein